MMIRLLHIRRRWKGLMIRMPHIRRRWLGLMIRMLYIRRRLKDMMIRRLYIRRRLKDMMICRLYIRRRRLGLMMYRYIGGLYFEGSHFFFTTIIQLSALFYLFHKWNVVMLHNTKIYLSLDTMN